jgi:hypothetical protein
MDKNVLPIIDDSVMGLEITVTPEEAEELGAFVEDALSEEDAKEAIETEG